MNYLPQLTEDEVRFICSVIPHQDTISYFTKNPKEFAKILPGFRVKSLPKARASKLLFDYHGRDFISHFLEKHISDWLSQIQEHFTKRMESGDSIDIALINTLPFCFFANNVSLYFRLVNEEYSEEYITLLSATVKSIKEATDEQDRLNEKIKVIESEYKKLRAKLGSKDAELDRSKDRLISKLSEIDVLKSKISALENLQVAALRDKEVIDSLQKEKRVYLDKIERLTTELAEAKSNSLLLEEKIRTELQKQQKYMDEEKSSAARPKCPCNLEEFKDYLGYNLTNIGMPNDAEYFPLLIAHLGKILFQGLPVLVNHAIGTNLIKCVANTLIGNSTVKTISYSQDITSEKLSQFLLSAGRIVCLDNFIGNYNETELIPLVENHRDIIIFLTVAYDRTLQYLSKEFLRYCYYFNANRISALSVNTELTEDPSTIKEHNKVLQSAQVGNRFQNIFREILRELGYPYSLIEHKCSPIANEEDLSHALAFDALPYCVDVLQINPYNTSERLLKYAGKDGRCPQKNLLMGWFA